MAPKSHRDREHQKLDEEIIERTSPPGRVVYEAIYREGEHELERKSAALAWSGWAAGLSMGFSFLMEGVLRDYLPAGHWQPAVTKFGYSIGFLIVMLGRQQLFTKNTLTVMLPLLKLKQLKLLKTTAKLWLIVLVTNMAGAATFAWVAGHTNLGSAPLREQFAVMGDEAMQQDFGTMLLRAIFAGWLIALMIWLLPFAESAHIWIIVFFSYLIGIAHLPHIIAGSVPSLYAVMTGGASIGQWFGRFFAPVVIGNCIGGVAVVAMMVHAEFVEESKTDDGR